MLHVGMDLSRHRLDVRVLEDGGATVAELVVAPTEPELRQLAARFKPGGPVRGVIESMNGARFVHDTLELAGWEVEIADARRSRVSLRWRARPIASMPGCWLSCPAVIWSPPSGSPTLPSGPIGNEPGSGCTWCTTVSS